VDAVTASAAVADSLIDTEMPDDADAMESDAVADSSTERLMSVLPKIESSAVADSCAEDIKVTYADTASAQVVIS
jgi:hypothetical protein